MCQRAAPHLRGQSGQKLGRHRSPVLAQRLTIEVGLQVLLPDLLITFQRRRPQIRLTDFRVHCLSPGQINAVPEVRDGHVVTCDLASVYGRHEPIAQQADWLTIAGIMFRVLLTQSLRSLHATRCAVLLHTVAPVANIECTANFDNRALLMPLTSFHVGNRNVPLLCSKTILSNQVKLCVMCNMEAYGNPVVLPVFKTQCLCWLNVE